VQIKVFDWEPISLRGIDLSQQLNGMRLDGRDCHNKNRLSKGEFAPGTIAGLETDIQSVPALGQFRWVQAESFGGLGIANEPAGTRIRANIPNSVSVSLGVTPRIPQALADQTILTSSTAVFPA